MTRTRAIRMLAAGITFGLALVAIPAALRAQAGPDASRLRALFFQRDYETALLEGARIGASSSPEARAWHVLSQARRGMEDDAVAAARAMVKSAGGSGWSWLALAGALYIQGEKIDEAIQAGDKALQLMPGHPDAVWIRAQALLSDAKRRTEAIAFIDVMRRSSTRRPTPCTPRRPAARRTS